MTRTKLTAAWSPLFSQGSEDSLIYMHVGPTCPKTSKIAQILQEEMKCEFEDIYFTLSMGKDTTIGFNCNKNISTTDALKLMRIGMFFQERLVELNNHYNLNYG